MTRLKQAGAIVFGKTNTPEFAAGPNTLNALFGGTRNPWNLERSAGGSSGGVGGGAGVRAGPAGAGQRPRRLAADPSQPLRRGRVSDRRRARSRSTRRLDL